ncbi:MAG: hypothetical protein ACHREM_12735, partial [Polyangiales bacterium]
LVVRQGPQAPIGAAPKVALVDSELLVCDVRRRAGQTQILAADIDVSRRQTFVFAHAAAVAIVAGLWTAISKAAGTVQSALDSVDALLGGHFGATASRHKAADIDYGSRGFVASKTVGGALDELIDDLSSTNAGASGASRIAADAVPGVPKALITGSVRAQLAALLGWLNDHLSAVTGAHAASAIAATPFAFVASTSVQAQLQELAGDLQSAATGQGAALVGSEALGGKPRAVAATKLHDQVAAILDHINAHIGSGDHDGRYLRRVFSKGLPVHPLTVVELTTLSARPDHVTVAYSQVDAALAPVQPLIFAGPLSSNLVVSVSKSPAGAVLSVTNNSPSTLYVAVDAYVL